MNADHLLSCNGKSDLGARIVEFSLSNEHLVSFEEKIAFNCGNSENNTIYLLLRLLINDLIVINIGCLIIYCIKILTIKNNINDQLTNRRMRKTSFKLSKKNVVLDIRCKYDK